MTTPGRQELEECTLELLDESRNPEFDKAEERVYRLVKSGGFAERYIRHRTDIILRLSWGELGEYCILLHRPLVDVNGIASWSPQHSAGATGHGQEKAVLILIPVLLQAPHGLITVRVRSEARLVKFDPILHGLTHAGHVTWGVSIPQGRIVEDREFRSSAWRASSPQDKLPGQVVKGRPQVIQNIADNRQGRRLDRTIGDLKAVITRNRVLVTDDGIWWEAPESLGLAPQFGQVLSSPCYLDPDTIEFMHEVYSKHDQRQETPHTKDAKGSQNPRAKRPGWR